MPGTMTTALHPQHTHVYIQYVHICCAHTHSPMALIYLSSKSQIFSNVLEDVLQRDQEQN